MLFDFVLHILGELVKIYVYLDNKDKTFPRAGSEMKSRWVLNSIMMGSLIGVALSFSILAMICNYYISNYDKFFYYQHC